MWQAIMDVTLGGETQTSLTWLVESCQTDIDALQAKATEVTTFFQNGLTFKKKQKRGEKEGDKDMEGGNASTSQNGDENAESEAGQDHLQDDVPRPPANQSIPSGDSDPTGLSGNLAPLTPAEGSVSGDPPATGAAPSGDAVGTPPVRTSGRKTQAPRGFAAGTSVPRAAAASSKKRKQEDGGADRSKRVRGSAPKPDEKVARFWQFQSTFVKNAVSL